MSILKKKNSNNTWEVVGNLPDVLSGSSDPTSSTWASYIGQSYLNTTTGVLFSCTAISGSVYTWSVLKGVDNRLPASLGTSSQVLSMNSEATAIEWKTISLDMAINITYTELVTLITNSQLKPGMLYRITDYVTTTNSLITSYQATGNQYDIIVCAATTNSLFADARAAVHSGDTYFANNNLEAWELKYDINNDDSKYRWADTTNGKGIVYYLKDEFNNSAWYDFKCVKIKTITTPIVAWSGCPTTLTISNTTLRQTYGSYYYTFYATADSADNTLRGTATNCHIGRYKYYNSMIDIPTIILATNYTTMKQENVRIGDDCTNIIITAYNNGQVNLTIEDKCTSIYGINDPCMLNLTIKSESSSIVIDNQCTGTIDGTNLVIYNMTGISAITSCHYCSILWTQKVDIRNMYKCQVGNTSRYTINIVSIHYLQYVIMSSGSSTTIQNLIFKSPISGTSSAYVYYNDAIFTTTTPKYTYVDNNGVLVTYWYDDKGHKVIYYYNSANSTWVQDNKYVQVDNINSGSSTANQVLSSNGSSGAQWTSIPDQHFMATYDVTTFAQITAALDAGKICYVQLTQDGYTYIFQLTRKKSDKYYFTACYDQIYSGQITVNTGDEWELESVSFETLSNKSTAVTSSSTDDQYPTAKAVYSYHDISKQDVVSAGDGISNSGGGTTVEANVPLTGDEDELISLKVGNTVYQNLNYHPFPDAFVVNKTLQEFGQSIVGYTGFATGCVWYGGIQCTDLPGDMIQVECKVTAIRDTVDFVRNIAIVEIYSSEVAPFYWHYNTDSWNEGTGLDDWKYVASIDRSKLDSTAAINDSYNVMVRKVSAAAGSTGWEFYTEKPGSSILDGNNVGTIVPFGGSSIPVGYLECNGVAVSRTTYSELFAIIGTTYGSGDGSTTFNLPDLRDKFIEGSSSTKAVGTVISAGLPNITGKFSVTCDEDCATHDAQSPIALCHNNYAGAFTGSHTNKAIRNISAVYDRRGESNYDNEVNFNASTSNSIYGNSTTVQPDAVAVKYIIKYTKTLGATSEPDNTNIKYDSNGKLTLSKILQSGTHITIDANNKIQLNNAISVGSIAASDMVSLSAGGRFALEDNDFSGIENSKNNLQEVLDTKTKVSVSATGSSTSEIKYITVNDSEYKISSGESELPAYPTDTTYDYTLAITYTDGKWVKYWKALPSTSNVVGIGQVDYMTL